jgi:hypothetical protein
MKYCDMRKCARRFAPQNTMELVNFGCWRCSANTCIQCIVQILQTLAVRKIACRRSHICVDSAVAYIFTNVCLIAVKNGRVDVSLVWEISCSISSVSVRSLHALSLFPLPSMLPLPSIPSSTTAASLPPSTTQGSQHSTTPNTQAPRRGRKSKNCKLVLVTSHCTRTDHCSLSVQPSPHSFAQPAPQPGEDRVPPQTPPCHKHL